MSRPDDQQQEEDHRSRTRRRPKNALLITASVLQIASFLLSLALMASTVESLSFDELRPCPSSSYAANMEPLLMMDRAANQSNAAPALELPCIMWDVGPATTSNATEKIVVTVVQVTPALCSDHRDGAPTAIQLLNQENEGRGIAIGYYNDHYVHFRLISVVASYPEQHLEILTDMVETIKPQYILGTCSPAADMERDIAQKYRTILMAQVGPPSYYEGGNNTYLFGFHLSSSGYTKATMQSLRFNAITDIPGGLPAQPVRIFYQNDGHYFVSTCEAALNFALDFGLTDVESYSFDPILDATTTDSDQTVNRSEQVAQLNQLADEACPPGVHSDYRPAMFVCSLSPAHDILLDRWRQNGCQPISIWMTSSTQPWAAKNLDTLPYFQGGAQWHPSFNYRDKYFTSGTAFLDAQEKTVGYRGTYDMVVSYSIITLFAKHLQWSYRVANTPMVELDFGTAGGYEKLRRDLMVLKTQTLFGPYSLQVGQQQNSGREVAGTQWVPLSENTTTNLCTSPLNQAETIIKIPAPSALGCNAGFAISMSKIQTDLSILSSKCEPCPLDTFSTGKGTNSSCMPCLFGTNTNNEMGAIACVATDDNILSRSLVSMSFVFACIVWSLALSMLSWIFRHRESDVVKTSRNYLLTMLAGAILSSTFIIMISLHGGTESSTQIATVGCQIAPFLYCIGWVLMLGSVAGLAHPVSKHPLLPHVYSYVEPKSPFPMYLALAFDVVLLVLWTLLNPLEYSRWVVSETIDLETGLVTIDTVGFCSAGGEINTWLFVGPIAVVHAALLLRIVYLFFFNLKMEDKYGQRRLCLFAALYSAQLLLIGVPVLLAVGSNTTAQYAVMCALVFCNDLGVVSIIFFPIRNRRKTCDEYNNSKEEAPLSKRAKVKVKADRATELRKAKFRNKAMHLFTRSITSDGFNALDIEALGLPEPEPEPEPSMSSSSLNVRKIDQFDCTEES